MYLSFRYFPPQSSSNPNPPRYASGVSYSLDNDKVPSPSSFSSSFSSSSLHYSFLAFFLVFILLFLLDCLLPCTPHSDPLPIKHISIFFNLYIIVRCTVMRYVWFEWRSFLLQNFNLPLIWYYSWLYDIIFKFSFW